MYVRLFSTELINSDQANALLVAQDMVAGNWRLHGWWMAPDNYWGLDELVFAAVWATTHHAILTIRLAAIVAWIGLGVVMLCLGAGVRRGRLMGLLVLLATILIPNTGAYAALFYFNAPLHVPTVTFIILDLMMIQALLNNPTRFWARWMVFLFISVDAAFSDPLFIYLGALPIIVALLLNASASRVMRISLVLATGLAVMMAKLLVWINADSGGFHPLQLQVVLQSIYSVPHTIVLSALAVMSIFGCVPVGHDRLQILIAVLRLPMIGYVFVVVFRVAKLILWRIFKEPRWATNLDFIDTALCLILCADLASVLLSTAFQDMAGVRFFLPAWVAASILAARYIDASRTNIIYFSVVSMIAIFMAGWAAFNAPPGVNFPAPTMALVEALEQHQLRYGYGTYWQASDAVAASGGEVMMRAVIADHTGRLMPYRLFSKTEWYAGQPDNSEYFIVIPDDKIWYDQADVESRFGAPKIRFHVNDMWVYVYSGGLPSLN